MQSTRLRGFPSLNALLRVLMLHVARGNSLRETVVRAKLVELDRHFDVALLKRLRNSEEWLRLLCSGGRVAQPTTSIGKMACRVNIASRPTDRNVPVVRSRPQCRVVSPVLASN
jgi:hypothetical protein